MDQTYTEVYIKHKCFEAELYLITLIVLLKNVEYQLSQMITVVMNTSKDYSVQLAFLFHKDAFSVSFVE